jgi:outer membrane protein TolC
MKFWLYGLAFSLASSLAFAAAADDLAPELSDIAEDVAPASEAADPGATSAAVEDANRLQLSLAEAIDLALQNNLDVEVQRFDPLIAGELETEAWGAYDPELFSEFGYSDIDEPTGFTLEGSTVNSSDSYDGFGGFRGLLPYLGSQYSVQFGGERVTSNLPVQSFSPEYRSSYLLAITQPLMRGLIWNEAWTRVKRQRVLYDESLENFTRRLMDTVQQVEDAYWNLIATSEQKRVAEKSLETAKALLSQTKTQYDVGVVSKVEVVEAEAGVADRDFNLIVADNLYRTAQDQVINLVLGVGLTADSALRIEPSDAPKDYVAYSVDTEEATQRAFEKRPELKLADDAIERQKIESRFARNSRLPQLDAQLSYGNRGLTGRQNPNLIDPNTGLPPLGIIVPEGDFGDTTNDFLTGDAADQFAARALLSIPLPNTAARARVSQAELALRRATSERKRLEQNIILEVRKFVRDLESAQEGIRAAERRRVASEEQLRAERIRLEYGESTPFDVLQREQDLVQAESEKIEALRIYRVSATDLDRAQGTILNSNNVVVEEVGALR